MTWASTDDTAAKDAADARDDCIRTVRYRPELHKHTCTSASLPSWSLSWSPSEWCRPSSIARCSSSSCTPSSASSESSDRKESSSEFWSNGRSRRQLITGVDSVSASNNAWSRGEEKTVPTRAVVRVEPKLAQQRDIACGYQSRHRVHLLVSCCVHVRQNAIATLLCGSGPTSKPARISALQHNSTRAR